MTSLFRGVSAFPITPANEDGRVDTDMLSHLVDRLCAAGVDSIGLLGSTGTYAYLTHDERRRAVEAAVECSSGRVPLVVGVGALRSDLARDLARAAERAGADGLLMAPVSYTPLTQADAFEHYRTVAEATPLPFCVYNNPSTTHFTFSVDLLEQLSRLPTIKAVKMPLPAGGDFAKNLAELRQRMDLIVGYSGDWLAADALLAGADTWFSVVAGILPVPSLALGRAGLEGDRETTERLNDAFQPLWQTFKAHGSLRVMYVLIDVLGLGKAELPRPLLSLSDVDRQVIADAVEPLLDRAMREERDLDSIIAG
ncbi:dihydrodipicolinate synthase family protein [Aureimonas altamirensis]|uniref:dihydrodipicolinate synthase family protein n=1 Tax=Aureimonas altamirensis TaxID=370622 RepID=UPI001E4180E8|nr:dihydrodipicolinate synthase family protein [Aureimonas altamirensis]UHD45762.1 dihydrodipicolinate synthase family protein [Aureimonas altamirensis]